MSKALFTREIRDKIAVTLSMLCILQCIFLPFVVTLLPFLDFWWLSDHFLHPFLLLVIIPLTILTLLPAYFRHRNFQPMLIALPALVLLAVGAFIPESVGEKMLTVTGAVILAVAHIHNMMLNRRLAKHSPC